MEQATTTDQLPRWDVSDIFPGLESSEFDRAFHDLIEDIAALEELFDRHSVAAGEAIPADQRAITAFEEVVRRFDEVWERLLTISAYVRTFVATDSYDDVAHARASELQMRSIPLARLSNRFTAWIGSLDVEGLLQRSLAARDLAFPLRKTKQDAAHLMSPPEEDLAAEMTLSGGSAWSKLHSRVTSQLIVPIERNGERQELPMSVVRNLAHDPDREVRRRAYEAEIGAWKRAAVPLSAALNGVKGETNTLERHRKWESALDVALFHNNIDRATLDAMLAAARESFPDFRRYLRAKAQLIGVPTLAWYDLFAPVGESTSAWDWTSGTEFLLEQFGTYSERLQRFASKALERRWIDAEPRAGKVQGAFCMAIGRGDSRVLTNYLASYDGISTLAHELGHAYHNFNLRERSFLQRGTPMTLAETASIFCETIIENAALRRADRPEQIAILESSLQGRCQVVVDIFSRFIFENTIFDARLRRELSVDELCEHMVAAQRETYGDGLDQSTLHPYMWAAKTHYYRPGLAFYNFPYMFGLLFGLGLYTRYEQDPQSFRDGYDELLSSTGLADAATLAGRFGFDIRSPEFWRSSFDIIRRQVAEFEQLAAAWTVTEVRS